MAPWLVRGDFYLSRGISRYLWGGTGILACFSSFWLNTKDILEFLKLTRSEVFKFGRLVCRILVMQYEY